MIIGDLIGDFIESNNFSVEKYFPEVHFELYFLKNSFCCSIIIDYLNCLIRLPCKENKKKITIYCCKYGNNQSSIFFRQFSLVFNKSSKICSNKSH